MSKVLTNELVSVFNLSEFMCQPTTTEIKCEHYDASKCEKNDVQSCTTIEACQGDEKPNHCFVLWREDLSGNVTVAMKGCFTENQICNQTECIDANSANSKKNMKFCCCTGDLCNKNHMWIPVTTEFPEFETPVPSEKSGETLILVLIVITIVTTALCICTASIIYKNRRSAFNQIPTNDDPVSNLDAELELLSIKLLEIKARGRYGIVWKAQMIPEDVAVKIFPMQDKQSWLTEQEIFKLPRMSHPNILNFIGAKSKKDDESGEIKLWLVTSYHQNGSLCDYLKSHTVTWPELCKIAESMARGLMHLHEEISGKGDGIKPAIAHRDFKSKNVLLKDDLTACIADFGLALIFKPGTPCGDTHGQVGTRRYMAPEILEGAINFTRDAFLRIDVYACGLVLWELVSRCNAHGGIVSDYTLPFEVEVNTFLNINSMILLNSFILFSSVHIHH